MTRCAWTLLGSLFFLLSKAIGTPATLALPFRLTAWIIDTPAALIAVAALAAWHLASFHAPRTRRYTPAPAHAHA